MARTNPGKTLMLRALPCRSDDAAGNMALDSLLLESVPPAEALFRSYGWSEQAVTFGFSQPFSEVRALFPETTGLCRRPTGGGIVDHRNDWTYCLALGSELPATRRPAPAFYCFLHQTILDCLKTLGVKTQLAPCTGPEREQPDGPNRCFAAPAPSDLVLPDGRKLAGAALRRTRHGILVQGSLDRAAFPPSFPFAELEKQLPAALAAAFGLRYLVGGVDEAGLDPQRIEEERARFASATWNRRR